KRLTTRDPGFEKTLLSSLSIPSADDHAIDQVVLGILERIEREGDAALLQYTQQFDRLAASQVRDLEITSADLAAAYQSLPQDQASVLQAAAKRVRAYHERQKTETGCHSWEYTESNGTRLGQKITPLDRVGIYVPGGKAAYPSSVLMNAIPAKVAGVAEIVMVVPTPDGARNPLVLAAAHLAGVDRVFTIGGAQAVGALAYGTQTVPAVDKIVGPGNAYVAAAKRRVFGRVGIDMIAGPSEILVLCDGSTDPDWIAMDLFSQAEHDELAQSILLCPDKGFIDRVDASIQKLLPQMPREKVIRASLQNRALLIEVDDMAQACQIANLIAAEHLEICANNP
ncbi:MAG: histidinol dehydrogenase, partial [Burkholderiaceae bacterium]|nr:histidinol dehydrogenase [Burkholderiaceae bacterium]